MIFILDSLSYYSEHVTVDIRQKKVFCMYISVDRQNEGLFRISFFKLFAILTLTLTLTPTWWRPVFYTTGIVHHKVPLEIKIEKSKKNNFFLSGKGGGSPWGNLMTYLSRAYSNVCSQINFSFLKCL